MNKILDGAETQAFIFSHISKHPLPLFTFYRQPSGPCIQESCTFLVSEQERL